jgi:hypothetical protein
VAHRPRGLHPAVEHHGVRRHHGLPLVRLTPETGPETTQGPDPR